MTRSTGSRIAAIVLAVAACATSAVAVSGAFIQQTPPPPTTSAPPSNPPAPAPAAATPAPAPASTPTQPAVSAQTSAPVGGEALRIYMPDGQLKSHSVRVYVSRDILPTENPRLQLLRSHAVTRQAVDEAALHEPGLVAPHQEWVESVDGQQVRRSGTLLLFDLSKMDVDYKAMVRVTPVVSWTHGATKEIAIADREVNVGNIVAAIGWTVVAVGLALVLVIWLSRRNGGSPVQLLTGVDGHLALSQTQIACWTVVVGGVVLGYGLIKLDIPDIPTSLLVLMGASLTTGGVGFFQDVRNRNAAVAAGVAPIARTWALGDLVRSFPTGQPPELSLAKAQMMFWTLLLLVLFVSKSTLDGTIWDIPWPLVALMGFSQAGYLAPKLAPQS